MSTISSKTIYVGVIALVIGAVACGPKPMQIKTFPTTHNAADALENNTVVAVVGDYPVVAFEARESAGRFEVVGKQFQVDQIGIGFSKEAPELKAVLTDALRKVMTGTAYTNILLTWALNLGKIDPPPPLTGTGVPAIISVPQLQDLSLKVGMEVGYAPMEFKDEFKREAGVDVELAQAIGRQLGVDVVLVDMPFDALIGAVETGKVDIIMSTMTITAERSQRIDFIPYLAIGSGMLVKRGNPNQIRSVKDLCGRPVAVQDGAAQISILQSYPCK